MEQVQVVIRLLPAGWFPKLADYSLAWLTCVKIFRPLATTVSATFGILATSAINQKWGLTLW